MYTYKYWRFNFIWDIAWGLWSVAWLVRAIVLGEGIFIAIWLLLVLLYVVLAKYNYNRMVETRGRNRGY